MSNGRQADAEGKVVPIAGGKRFAAVLKSIWYLSANDNPYADWILIEEKAEGGDMLAKIARARPSFLALTVLTFPRPPSPLGTLPIRSL